jgi:S-adenosylmethionine:tRNA ribosyltransferase-isomerase
MKTSEFFFDLPQELIANYPPPERGESRLMVLDRRTGCRTHRMVKDLPDILDSFELHNPLMVFNNSRVRKARLKGVQCGQNAKETSFLLLNRVDAHTWRVMVNHAKRCRPKQRFCFANGLEGEIVPPSNEHSPHSANTGEFRYLRFDSPIDDDWLDIHGHIPLPPYIKREDEEADTERYQTIYADRNANITLGPGASTAAPTAGLHFTQSLFDRLEKRGIEKVFITLHVGLGTFLPVRTENIEDHIMHEEVYSISEEAAGKINAAKEAGRKIIAVGTTSMRTLESAWTNNGVQSGENTTSIFIYPGYRFRVADMLVTNFHTPGSTLLMLVSAFAGSLNGNNDTGRRLIMESYTEAIRGRYRFFSYGDAMLMV